jgi:type II secretory pathway component PulC
VKLFAIVRGSLLDRAGFCSGDVVRSINGRKLDTPEAVEANALAMRGERDFVIAVLRDGKPLELHVVGR